MLITSLDNDKIKKYIKLKEKKYRDQFGEFLVEGEHLVIEAYRSGLLEEILIKHDEVTMLDAPITYISSDIVNALSTLEAPSHIFGVCKKVSGKGAAESGGLVLWLMLRITAFLEV